MRTPSALSLLLLLAPAALAPALTPAALGAPATVEFTVAAGKLDRLDEPVRVPLTLPADQVVGPVAVVRDGAKTYPAQVTTPDLLTENPAPAGKTHHDLWFILPALKAGETKTLTATLDPDLKTPGDAFTWVDEGERWAELRRGGRPVLRYVFPTLDESSPAQREATFKVFHHVYDPQGKRLVTKGVGGQFTHHRGLFYGFMKTKTPDGVVDIWHCKGETHQAHKEISRTVSGPVVGRQRVEIAWNGVKKQTFAVEQRELSSYAVPGGTLIDFTSVVTPTGGPIEVDGDPQHAGFHFRADNEVSAKTSKETIFIRPDGTDKPGATRNWDGKGNKTHVDLPWLAMSFVVGGQRYTACYLDRPDNPKEARFSERNYGRLGSYFVRKVTKDDPLRVRYRVWLQEGAMTGEQVAARSAAFVTPVEVKVK